MDHRGSSHGGQAGGKRATRLTRHAIVTAMSALALWGVVPAAANASTTWQWREEAITTTKPVKWKGTLKLQTQYNGFGNTTVKCEETGTGTVGPAGVGEVKTWTNTSVRVKKHANSAELRLKRCTYRGKPNSPTAKVNSQGHARNAQSRRLQAHMRISSIQNQKRMPRGAQRDNGKHVTGGPCYIQSEPVRLFRNH